MKCRWQTVPHDWPGHRESSVAKFRPCTWNRVVGAGHRGEPIACHPQYFGFRGFFLGGGRTIFCRRQLLTLLYIIIPKMCLLDFRRGASTNLGAAPPDSRGHVPDANRCQPQIEISYFESFQPVICLQFTNKTDFRKVTGTQLLTYSHLWTTTDNFENLQNSPIFSDAKALSYKSSVSDTHDSSMMYKIFGEMLTAWVVRTKMQILDQELIPYRYSFHAVVLGGATPFK